MCDKSLQWCPTLCDPMDCSLPGSSAHGTLQATILEWVADSSSRGSSLPGIKPMSLMFPPQKDRGFFTTEPLGKPIMVYIGPQSKDHQ